MLTPKFQENNFLKNFWLFLSLAYLGGAGWLRGKLDSYTDGLESQLHLSFPVTLGELSLSLSIFYFHLLYEERNNSQRIADI